MSSFSLKMIALLTMICDHVGYTLFPGFLVLRAVGRLAFPIYAFLVAEGYRKTSNPNKYAMRLAIFAVISEIPFDMVFFNSPLYMEGQNVFLTLLLGLLAVMTYDRLTKRRMQAAAMISVLACALAASVLKTDYEFVGVLMIFVFFVCKDNTSKAVWITVLAAANAATQILSAEVIGYDILFWGGLQLLEIAALPIIFSYNGKLGPRLKYFFYAAYPVHLLILYVIVHWKGIFGMQ